ncbi:MAG: hypothetical protein IPL40_00650 [Proteobacteria bacterium]|nr:hypothetical protein [Pseudomonadota bacterium]
MNAKGKAGVRVVAVVLGKDGMGRVYFLNALVAIGALPKNIEAIATMNASGDTERLVRCLEAPVPSCWAPYPKLAPNIRMLQINGISDLYARLKTAVTPAEFVSELYLVDHAKPGSQGAGEDRLTLKGDVDGIGSELLLTTLLEFLDPQSSIVHLEGCSAGKDQALLARVSTVLHGTRVRGADEAQATGLALTGQDIGPEGNVMEAKGTAVRKVPPGELTALHRILP